MITHRNPFNTIEEVGHIDRLRRLHRLDARETRTEPIGDGKNRRLGEFDERL